MSESKQRILINATQPEESRIALVSEENSKYHLYDVEYERKGYEQRLGNLYSGRITRIEDHLEAVFFDFGGKRQGFLPKREIDPNYYDEEGKLRVGQKMLIQVKKEERGNKGAALSTFISLAGSYLVLMPNNPRAGGISRRIEGEERSELREVLNRLEVPEDMGIIIRTAGINKSHDDLQWDLNILLQQWQAIEKAYQKSEGPQLIYQESDLTIRAIRDHLRNKVDEIWVDQPDVHKKIKNYLQQIRPDYVSRLKLYKRQTPLFTHYQIESQIETAFQRNVVLPSGGAIVIDHTEALTTIDINSARATTGGDIEETALNTNLEAVEETARQLRLRDIGGLVVIDLIDMSAVANRQRVEQHLADILQKRDPARVQVGRISRFGLLEMSRQRLRPTLGESSQELCPRCMGEGYIRGIQPLALAIMRLLSEYAMDGSYMELRAFVPTNVASYLMNEKRNTINKIEQNFEVKVIIVPTATLETPHYKIECMTEDMLSNQSLKCSYQLTYTPDSNNPVQFSPISSETPAVANILTSQDSGMNINIVKRLWQSVFGNDEKADVEEEPTPPTKTKNTRQKSTRSNSTKQRSSSNSKRATGSSSNRSRSNSGTRSKDSSRERKRSSSDPKRTPRNRDRDNSENTSSRKKNTKPKPKTTPKTVESASVETAAPITSKEVTATTPNTEQTATESKPRSRRQTRRKRTNPSSTARAKASSSKTQTADTNANPSPAPVEDNTSTQAAQTSTSTASSRNVSESSNSTPAKRAGRRRGRYVRVRKGTPRKAAEESTKKSVEKVDKENTE